MLRCDLIEEILIFVSYKDWYSILLTNKTFNYFGNLIFDKSIDDQYFFKKACEEANLDKMKLFFEDLNFKIEEEQNLYSDLCRRNKIEIVKYIITNSKEKIYDISFVNDFLICELVLKNMNDILNLIFENFDLNIIQICNLAKFIASCSDNIYILETMLCKVNMNRILIKDLVKISKINDNINVMEYLKSLKKNKRTKCVCQKDVDKQKMILV